MKRAIQVTAGADAEMLRLELGDLKLAGFDLSLTGFGELELGSLLADKTEGLTDPDGRAGGSRASGHARLKNRRPHSSGCSLSHSVLLPASGVGGPPLAHRLPLARGRRRMALCS